MENSNNNSDKKKTLVMPYDSISALLSFSFENAAFGSE